MGQKDPIKRRKRMTAAERASRPSFEARISQAAQVLQEPAFQLPPGKERDALLRRARLMNADHVRDWLSSPGLQAPK
jgi:hypothetical protein